MIFEEIPWRDFVKAENVIATSAAFISLGATLIAWKSLVTSKKALAIAKLDFEEKHFEVTPYLIEGIRWTEKESKTRFVSFAVSYSNRASSPNSLSRIGLEISWIDAAGHDNVVTLQPDFEKKARGFGSSFEMLTVPLNLMQKETRSGWLNFKIPEKQLGKIRIDKYTILATSINGTKIAVSQYLVQEVEYES